jgi:mono/diheme cytochrome c family protein/glucose/arabinose dehydrogenase
MKKMFVFIPVLMAVSVLIFISLQSCKQTGSEKPGSDSLTIRKKFSSSPVLSAQESIEKMHVEKGFAVKIVATEPLVNSPVALTFDEKGRIWVAEMPNYMPDTVGTGEDAKTGKIVILSDKNGDGLMDERKVFLDSLVLPRAICLIEDGILVAEPPNLWYYKIENDLPIKKTLVDPEYAAGGNVEHQPNGLLRALDNWIYNAKSDKRYRKKGDKWIIEKTHFRGQWGLSQDDYGRLYYNTNSENLLADYFTPGFGAGNKNQQSVAGFVKNIVPDNRTYPVRATTGVNRGYMPDVLDDSLRLTNFTAACSPAYYTSALFGKKYYGNVFVAEPSANLIKRNILADTGYIIKGRQAYANKEFLASEDERFRPVNLYEGPDGALYITDMYRGIIQHKTYLTPYLKNEIKERKLTTPLNYGRIYKVVPDTSKQGNVVITKDPNVLLELLGNKNGWVRNKAQQLLVDGKFTQAEPALRDLLKRTDEPVTLTHALWTMEGLGVLKTDDVLPLLKQHQWNIRMQALSVLPSILNKRNYKQFLLVFNEMVNKNDTLAAPYIAFLAHSIQPLNPAATKKLFAGLIKKFPSNIYVADAIISNLQDKEKGFYNKLMTTYQDSGIAIIKQLNNVINYIAKTKNNERMKDIEKKYAKGFALFSSTCQPCHGPDGNGVRALGPPLNGSEWVLGDKNKLISIVLFGLTGPVKVGEKIYKAPEVSGEMPAIGQNKEFNDEDIAQILSFIRNAWSNKAKPVSAADVLGVRNKLKDRQKSFTMEELNEMK